MKAKTLFQSVVLMIFVFVQALSAIPVMAQGDFNKPPSSLQVAGATGFKAPYTFGETFDVTGTHNRSGGRHALDFGTPLNTSVLAMKGGTITFAGIDADTKNGNGGGYMIKINHGEGICSLYLHLNQFIKKSGLVKQGELIALSGNTKTENWVVTHNAQTHLHVSVFKCGNSRNELPIIFDEVGHELNYQDKLTSANSGETTGCLSPDTTFCDVPKDHPRYAAIETGYRYGLFSGVLVNINGVQRRFFYPSDDLLRQHGAMIVTRGLYFYISSNYEYVLPPTTGGIFLDMAGGDDEPSRAVEMLYREGGTTGFSDGTFKPIIAATRKDFIYFVMRILMKHVPITSAQCTFSDTDDLAIRKACDLGLVNGNNGAFNPEQPLSRELAALIACRAFIATTNIFIRTNQCGDTTDVNTQLILLRDNAREPHSSKYLCFTAPLSANGKIPGVNITSDGMVLNYEYASKSYKVGCPSENSVLTGKLIAINPGHGYYRDGNDWKHSGAFDGKEDDLNLKMASFLNDALKDADVIPLRELDDTPFYPYNNIYKWSDMGAGEYTKNKMNLPEWVWNTASSGKPKDRDINARPFGANVMNAEIMVSIHNNSSLWKLHPEFQPQIQCGSLIIYEDKNSRSSQSKQLADKIQNAMSKGIDANGYCGARVVKASDYHRVDKNEGYGEVTWFNGPAVLVEVGNMRNWGINSLLYNPAFQKVAMSAIKDGISDYYKSLSADCPSLYTWRVEYWSNSLFDGKRTLCKADSDINYAWGNGGPAGLRPDKFSLRATSTQDLKAGRYLFHLSGNGGLTLWIDGNSLARIDQPNNQGYPIDLTDGKHSFMLEYAKNGDQAAVKLSWEPILSPCPTGQYQAQYFNNTTLSGESYSPCEKSPINWNWKKGSPGNGVGDDNFSVRWTRQAYFNAGTYDFIARADDGVRVWLDGSLIIDEWKSQLRREHHAMRTVTAGNHSIKVEYYENQGSAFIQFYWKPKARFAEPFASPSPTLTPTITTTTSPTSAFTSTNTLSSPSTPTPTPSPIIETDTPTPTTTTNTDSTRVLEPPIDTPTPTDSVTQ